MTPWYLEKFFKYAVGILLVLAIISLFYQLDALMKPVFDVAAALFLPIVFSFLLYYLLRPIVQFLEKFKLPRYLCIIFIYIFIAFMLVVFLAYLGPILAEQISALANLSVATFENLKQNSHAFSFAGYEINFDDEVKSKIFNLIQQATAILSQNLITIVGYITHLAVILAVIPFIVFYLLKDDRSIAEGFMRMVPDNFKEEIGKTLKNVDNTLSSYINGLVLVSGTLGLLLFIGYIVIGLKYALILSIIALIFTTIPFLGPFLAIAPALLISISQGHFMMLKVVIVFLIIQQTESNIISPLIIGHRLHIHPLTVILLLVAAGALYGLIGLLLATPAYAITKVIVANLFKICQLHFRGWKETN